MDLVERIIRLESNARRICTDEGTRTIEDELMYALSLALEMSGDPGSRRNPLRIIDVSSAAHVSERTLRDVFVEYFGMGPLSYIRTWQLHRIRAALLRAEPGQATVTSVAMRFGVWDLDAMAGRYRRLFGERPVETLRSKEHSLQRLEDSRSAGMSCAI